jgi:hypothetical protein
MDVVCHVDIEALEASLVDVHNMHIEHGPLNAGVDVQPCYLHMHIIHMVVKSNRITYAGCRTTDMG